MSGSNHALRHTAQRAVAGIAAATAALLVGCAAPPKPLYDWAGYQPAVYEHLKGSAGDPRTRIDKLEQQVQKTLAAGASPPPGMHGHLALLYSQLGDVGGTRRHLEAERQRFPESAAYVDFLLKNTVRREGQP